MSAAQATTPGTSGTAKSGPQNAVGIKETITSLIIAFMLAFLFRGFVIEGFVIPTGSMAPTLMGKHVRLINPTNGYEWPVGPWNYSSGGIPLSTQNGIMTKYPMAGTNASQLDGPLRSGDRVFVLKYLPMLQTPKRWDVVVFKNPAKYENYIKRLVGLPGEQVVIVDGDVFTRPDPKTPVPEYGWDAWQDADWKVARKSERVQRAMFQEVFDSGYAPAEIDPGYRSPFTGTTPGWDGVISSQSYQYTGTGDTSLAWNNTRPITDANSYNARMQANYGYSMLTESDAPRSADHRGFNPFPVSDVSVALNIEAQDAPLRVSPVLEARGMEFRAVLDSTSKQVSVEMRDGVEGANAWTTLESTAFAGFTPGDIHHVEFWHVDQALWLFVDDELVCGGPETGAYELTPAQRAAAATGMSWEELELYPTGNGVTNVGVFAKPEIYRKPSFRWDFGGGAFTLHHVSVERDIAYQVNRNKVTFGGHPGHFATLTGDEYFMCGDNSANSTDSRLWEPGSIDRWVEQEINDRVGVVDKDLIVGKAFVVYFPAMHDGGIPIGKGRKIAPDFGRVRWIW
tara:strand:- start:62860 stop:64563 length:1704 start_codon:yes stop_codon:yes gene_type:complete